MFIHRMQKIVISNFFSSEPFDKKFLTNCGPGNWPHFHNITFSFGCHDFDSGSVIKQSVTFLCRYWSRDWYRDHFGLENGLETALVTLGSVTFGLKMVSRPFWSQKMSRDPVLSLSGHKSGWLCVQQLYSLDIPWPFCKELICFVWKGVMDTNV